MLTINCPIRPADCDSFSHVNNAVYVSHLEHALAAVLSQMGYDGDWYAFDVLSKKFDQLETFKIVMEMTRSLESITERLDPVEVENLIIEQNPAKSVQYLYSLV